MENVLHIIGYILVSIGVIFLFMGSLGIFRMPDVYTRMQAGTKATTLGAFGTILGVGFLNPDWFFKTAIIAAFILISNPISSHALARGAYKSGIKLWQKNDIDHYKNAQKEAEEEVSK